MFIVQQKREEIRVVEKDNRREEEKKKKKKGGRRSNPRCQCGGNLLHWVCSNHAFLLFFLSVFVLVEFLFSDRNVRYTPVRPVLSAIGRYLERYILKVFRYRFIDQYEKFRPYRPIRYDINFLGIKSQMDKAYCRCVIL